MYFISPVHSGLIRFALGACRSFVSGLVTVRTLLDDGLLVFETVDFVCKFDDRTTLYFRFTLCSEFVRLVLDQVSAELGNETVDVVAKVSLGDAGHRAAEKTIHFGLLF